MRRFIDAHVRLDAVAGALGIRRLSSCRGRTLAQSSSFAKGRELRSRSSWTRAAQGVGHRRIGRPSAVHCAQGATPPVPRFRLEMAIFLSDSDPFDANEGRNSLASARSSTDEEKPGWQAPAGDADSFAPVRIHREVPRRRNPLRLVRLVDHCCDASAHVGSISAVNAFSSCRSASHTPARARAAATSAL